MKTQNIILKTRLARARKPALAMALLLAGMGMISSAHANNLHSPKGAEVFAVAPPAVKTITIGWSFPAQLETPDLVFKVYHTTNLGQPLREWALLTNVPGFVRDVILPADQPQQFFIMTASNYLGESDFAGSY